MAANATAPEQSSVRSVHVSTMFDTVIANMTVEGLRAIIRPILAANPGSHATFVSSAQKFLHRSTLDPESILFTKEQSAAPIPTPEFYATQRKTRALVGSGLAFEGLGILTTIIQRATPFLKDSDDSDEAWEEFLDEMATVDGDILLALTGLQYALWGVNGPRTMTTSELKLRDDLRKALLECKEQSDAGGKDFVFERGLGQLESAHM